MKLEKTFNLCQKLFDHTNGEKERYVQFKYSLSMRILHWLSAFIIVWVLFSGFSVLAMDSGLMLRRLITDFNISITSCFIPIFIFRIWNALKANIIPALEVSYIEHIAARVSHLLLYICVMTVLVSGLLMMREDYQIFYVITVQHLLNDLVWIKFFALFHHYTTILLAILVTIHVLAVVRHHRNGRDVMTRMI